MTQAPAITTNRAASGFEATLTFTAPADAVFDALTTTEGLSSWWMSASGDGLAGGEVRFDFGSDALVVRVDQADRPSAVRWTPLSCGALPEWVGTTIIFEVAPSESGGTRIDFRHHGLTSQLECFDTCRQGWEQYLPSLVSYVDTGKGRPLG